MGCGTSAPTPTATATQVGVPSYITAGLHPSSSPLPTSVVDHRYRFRLASGGVFIGPRLDSKSEIDALFLYPDPRVRGEMPPAIRSSHDGSGSTAAKTVVAKVQEIETAAAKWIHDEIQLFSSEEQENVLNVVPTPRSRGQQRKTSFQPLPWEGIAVELKEFDSPDDALKPWCDGQQDLSVPGVGRLESAGPLGAWASFAPHMYQQRFVLPNGLRVAHPMEVELSAFTPGMLSLVHNSAGLLDTPPPDLSTMLNNAPSMPQRIYRLYENLGRDAVSAVVGRMNMALRLVRAGAVVEGALIPPWIKTGKIVEAGELVEIILAQIPQWKTCFNAKDVSPVCGPFRDVLILLEDAMIYNWFEVQLVAQLHLGTWQVARRGRGDHDELSRTLWDRLVATAIEGVDKVGHAAITALRNKMVGRLTSMLELWFKQPESTATPTKCTAVTNDNVIELLFPDLPQVLERLAAAVDIHTQGIVAGEDAARTAADMEDLLEQYHVANPTMLLQKFREDDARPLEERREETYQTAVKAVAGFSSRYRRAVLQNDEKELSSLSSQWFDFCRFPHLVEQHFRRFQFFLVFPSKSTASNRAPKQASLRLWPLGTALDDTTKVAMSPFVFPTSKGTSKTEGGVWEDAVLEVSGVLNKLEGHSGGSLASDDPRQRWSPYPSEDFRGFECTAEVAVGVTYYFHFVLDGEVFLDHETPSPVKHGCEDVIPCRKVTFEEAVRVVTLNPLAISGTTLV